MIPLTYEIRRSARKTLAIEVQTDGTVLVRAPKNCPQTHIDAFLSEKESWIRSKQSLMEARSKKAEKITPLSPAEAKLYRQMAKEVLEMRTAYYAGVMGVTYQRISIRDQKTRWGSCSAQGNLNFNWRLILAPAGVLDYVVIHELAHRKEMNHSPRFWAAVAEIMPDYPKYRKWLRENGAGLQNY